MKLKLYTEVTMKRNINYNDFDKDKFENEFDDEFENEFDGEFEDEFDDDFQNTNRKNRKEKKKKPSIHTIFFIIVGLLFIFALYRLFAWNKGKDSGYDPNEDTTEFDTEPLDYIQPLSSNQLAGKVDDAMTTILCLGNSPFADDGENNALARALGEEMNATCVNASFANSFQSQKNADYDASYPNDGISLYQVTKALTTGDFSIVDSAAAAVSEEAKSKAQAIQSIDMTKIDAVVIMYDLSDYTDLRPVIDPNNADNLLTYCGALNASIKMVQEKYPYIRIIVLSTPACGKTIDDFYVDGDIQDLGNGTLVDYMGHEINVAISNGVSYIDTYFGAINVENRDELLKDDYHLNENGAAVIAKRFHQLITLD